jgi:hypothetical protein
MITTVQNWPNYLVVAEKYAAGLGAQLFPGSSTSFGPGATCDVWAIPISWMESLFQEDFWSIYVWQFGADAIKPYPKLIVQGSVIVSLDEHGNAQRRSLVYFGPDWNAYMHAKTAGEVEMGGNGVETSAAYRIDAERVRQAHRQCAVLEQAMAWNWARTGTYDPET